MNERGSVTFWVLGLAFGLLTLGVLSVDLWSLIGHRRELAGLADAAASAAVSAVDEAEWRRTQELKVDPVEATARVWSVLGDDPAVGEPRIQFASDGVTVTVSMTRTVETALLGLAGRDFVTVGAASRARASLHD